MTEEKTTPITDLLRSWSAGDPEAATAVLPLLYEELRRIANRYFQRERRHHTLQATALVHEVYLRLIDQNGIEWQSRSHFIGTVAHLMRQILVDHARHRAAAKRGGKVQHLTLVEAESLALERTPDLLQLDDALQDLAKVDARKAKIVELRFFGGLTIEETAEFLGVSVNTVARHWRRAKAWLFGQLKPSDAGQERRGEVS